MTTELLYLKDTYLFKTVANFVEMRENEKGRAIILDKTIFYPQGGGQPTDSGYIRSASAVFKVTFVGLDPDGIVYISNGGWGSNYHTAKDLWYLEKKQRKGSVLLVELHPQKALVETIDLLNQSMDQVTFYPIKK